MTDVPNVFELVGERYDNAFKHILMVTFPDVNETMQGDIWFTQFIQLTKVASPDINRDVLSNLTDLMVIQQQKPGVRDAVTQLQEFSTLMKRLEDKRVTSIDASAETTPVETNGRIPRIVCAANRLSDGTLLVGARHWDELMGTQLRVWLKAKGMTEEDWISREGRLEEEQGFVDQFGTFHSRTAAYQIAETQGQIIRSIGYEGTELYSEHLY